VDVARGRGMVRGPRGPRGLACFGEEDEPFDARSEIREREARPQHDTEVTDNRVLLHSSTMRYVTGWAFRSPR
jgi:hypothetical protein